MTTLIGLEPERRSVAVAVIMSPSRCRVNPQRCSQFLQWFPAYVQIAGFLGDDGDEAFGLTLYEETGLHESPSPRMGALPCELKLSLGDA